MYFAQKWIASWSIRNSIFVTSIVAKSAKKQDAKKVKRCMYQEVQAKISFTLRVTRCIFAHICWASHRSALRPTYSCQRNLVWCRRSVVDIIIHVPPPYVYMYCAGTALLINHRTCTSICTYAHGSQKPIPINRDLPRDNLRYRWFRYRFLLSISKLSVCCHHDVCQCVCVLWVWVWMCVYVVGDPFYSTRVY